MKIALVIRRLTPAGGAERACAQLAFGLRQRGHEIHVFAERITKMRNIVPHLVTVKGRTGFAANSRALLEKESFDIIHSFTRTSYQDILRLGGGIHREYLAQTEAAYSPLGRLWRRLRRKEKLELRLERESLVGAAQKIVAVSRRVRDEAIHHYHVPPTQIEVVYNAVDPESFAPDPAARMRVREELGLADRDYTLLFCGTGFRRKGLDFAVAAVDRVPRARLLVAGEGSRRKHPRVRMLGRVENVTPLYNAADALILPTLYDPFPNACLEAMSCGIPVIVSRIAGVSEIIDGDSIVVEHPSDVDRLAAAVRSLEDPKVRKEMGAAARRKAQKFSPERNLEENLRIYNAIVEKRGR